MEQSPQYNSTRHSPDSNTTASEKKIENQVDFKFADKPPINNNLLAGWKKSRCRNKFPQG